MSGDEAIALRCAKCDVLFYLTARYMQKRRDDHTEFLCPNGHGNYYPEPTLADIRDQRAVFRKPQLTLVKD